MSDVKRGDIWLINLDPAIGHEIKKARPGVIIQNDYGNKYSQITIIAPITSQKIEQVYPFEVFLKQGKALEKDSKALLNQIRAVDKIRLVKKLGSVNEEELHNIDDALKISLGLTEV
ncbi:TPA: type II toxin-antitoxin system PemK/MazF family toxin [Candidatus Woesearchaeota archaeon]|nr:type II toxin-antitoxin system PemK/MazF family toxin [Candidatus Woesearchaeota archaeon]